MNIALLGYGKMGKVVEEEALLRGHQIVLKINSQNGQLLTGDSLQAADMAIDFSTPESAVDHIYHCFDANIPVVVGTTGWLEHLNQITEDGRCRNQSIFHSSNFSLGVNLFFQVNEVMARMMNEFPEYDVSIEETHHLEKKDSPSGTALSLAERILDHISRKKGWVNTAGSALYPRVEPGASLSADPSPLLIQSLREDGVAGIHTICYGSDEDEILLTHTAKNRKGFARGAIYAAEWMEGKRGIFTMKDIMGY